MQTLRFHDMTLSRLMLGTVQFGLNYGIANRTGKPSYEQSRAILACAADGGVTCLDTASAYGTSEEILGKALFDLGLTERMVVVTKIAHIGDDTLTDREAEAHVERSVLSSLARLRLPVLPICLFHQEQDFRYIEALRTMQTKGLIRYIGCSVMTPQGAKAILATGEADALQVPVNLLDRRFEQSGIFRDAADKSIAVFGRSVYLQGLLLMAEADIPSALQSILAIRRELQTMAMGASLSLAEMAARYVLGMEGLSCALVGMETVEQMKKNLSYFLKGPLPADLNAAIVKIVPTLPEAIVNPSLWPARQEPTPGR